MKIIQLDKSMETIQKLDVTEYDKVYFLALKIYKSKKGTDNYTFNSKRLDYLMFRDIDYYLNDSEYILIRIEN